MILTGDQSTIEGYPSIAASIGKIKSIVAWCQGANVGYGLDCKPHPLQQSPPTFYDESKLTAPEVYAVDCSGFHRYALWHSTYPTGNGGIEVPDGSVNQNDWYASQGFKHHVIEAPDSPAYELDLDPDVLYACFCREGQRGEAIGHVWFVYGGQTYESYGGVGPGSRSAFCPILSHIVTDVYALGRSPA